MNADGTRLQQAIRQTRTMGPVKVWVLLSCNNDRCATSEVNVFIDETRPGVKVWQAPARCPRCAAELQFEGLEEERRN
jgi:hypothetical protein